MSVYDAGSIVVLKSLEAVRLRPAMYIGSTGAPGLHNMVVEVVQNAIDEGLAGHCSGISVTAHADGAWSVEDDGRGIPVDLHPELNLPACEIVFTMLHSGGKFADGVYRSPGGLHGVGLAAVNALSRRLVVDIWRDGTHYRQAFERGVPGPLERLEAATRQGTRVRFVPDPDIFAELAEARDDVLDGLRGFLQAQAFLVPGLEVRFADEICGQTEVHRYESGLAGYVARLNEDRPPVHADVIEIGGVRDDVEISAALQWTYKYAEDLRGFVNSIHTPKGGTHLDGMRRALTDVVNAQAAKTAAGEVIAGFDVREGLTAVLSVRLASPQFEGQTKSSLTSPEVEAACHEVVARGLAEHLHRHPKVAEAVVERVLEASRARSASRRASERARYRRRAYDFSREVYRQQFGIRSSNWHESARWITHRPLLDQHAELSRVPTDARVLDICCGSGVVGEAFRGRVGHITGLDITPEMVRLARTRLDDVVQADVYDIPFGEATFDLVCNREVLHLLPHPERPVSEVFRVLKPGGQFIVGQMVPYGPADAAWMFRVLKKKQPLFFNNFLEEDFRRLLEQAGFVDITVREVLQWESIDTWIDTWETSSLHRHEIRDLYHHAPAEVRAVHPFRIHPGGAIEDCWRWCVFSGLKPA